MENWSSMGEFNKKLVSLFELRKIVDADTERFERSMRLARDAMASVGLDVSKFDELLRGEKLDGSLQGTKDAIDRVLRKRKGR
mgnify:CR=1 FL=1